MDTQPAGGRLDGAYGGLAGLEVLRALDPAGIATRHPVEVVAGTNEEGSRFAPGAGARVRSSIPRCSRATANRATPQASGLEMRWMKRLRQRPSLRLREDPLSWSDEEHRPDHHASGKSKDAIGQQLAGEKCDGNNACPREMTPNAISNLLASGSVAPPDIGDDEIGNAAVIGEDDVKSIHRFCGVHERARARGTFQWNGDEQTDDIHHRHHRGVRNHRLHARVDALAAGLEIEHDQVTDNA
ncbi:M20/M25/M40 family metallo-hydrolase [Paraburkholderia sp. 31.1]|nr:M20/M25/M40 family metallo-hydrolase [Paraburkholderia sp. 31.1]